MYAAEVNGRKLTFEVECVWRRNMIIRDRETGSFWQHATGEAVAGPLKGNWLPLLGGELMTWGAMKEAYPQAMIALEPDEWSGIFSREFVMKVLKKATSGKTPPGFSPTDGRLGNDEAVIGIEVNGEFRAYPLKLVEQIIDIEEAFAGSIIRLMYDGPGDYVQVFADGRSIHYQRTTWSGWYEFHPATTIYETTAAVDR